MIWGPDRNDPYHPRHALPAARGVIAFLRSAFAVWRRGF